MLKQRVAQNTGNGQGARVTAMPTQLLYSEAKHLLCILLCFSPTPYGPKLSRVHLLQCQVSHIHVNRMAKMMGGEVLTALRRVKGQFMGSE